MKRQVSNNSAFLFEIIVASALALTFRIILTFRRNRYVLIKFSNQELVTKRR
jgi:hypothetical protein